MCTHKHVHHTLFIIPFLHSLTPSLPRSIQNTSLRSVIRSPLQNQNERTVEWKRTTTLSLLSFFTLALKANNEFDLWRLNLCALKHCAYSHPTCCVRYSRSFLKDVSLTHSPHNTEKRSNPSGVIKNNF